AQNGFFGDAISISKPGMEAVINHLANSLQIEDKKTLSIQHTMKENGFSDSEKKIILKEFEKRLSHFIFDRFSQFDLPNDTPNLEQWVLKNNIQGSYLICHMPYHYIRDFESYRLGKMGSQDVRPKDIKAIVHPKSEPHSVSPSCSNLSVEIPRAVINYYL